VATSLLALLDDIATVLDDVAVMTKVAARKSAAMADDVAVLTKLSAQKTAGVLGDDLALNAQQVTGVAANREVPVVWAVAKGSLINKAILVPAALAISALAPWAVTPLLMAGGAFLCFEGFEKLAHRLLHTKAEDDAHEAELEAALADPAVNLAALEKSKIRGAVRTDFILSAEIVAITLGAVAQAGFWTQVAVLVGIALTMTVGVYGLVGGIVKLDDLGLWLSRRASGTAQGLGRAILALAPWLMKALSIAGTAAMFLVGGGIIVHGVPALHHLLEAWTQGMAGIARMVIDMLFNAVVGIVVGGLVVAAVTVFRHLRGAALQR
jgi:predicted DNA repair protein MutK